MEWGERRVPLSELSDRLRQLALAKSDPRLEAADELDRLEQENAELRELVRDSAAALDIIANSGCDQAQNVRRVARHMERIVNGENGSSE